MSHKKFGPDRFSRFDVYWIQTNKQTDKPNIYIDIRFNLQTYICVNEFKRKTIELLYLDTGQKTDYSLL